MAELPIMPLKTDALLADTSHMTPEEFGAYCRILFVMWRHGGRLRDDDGELANIAGMNGARWKKIAEKVRRPLTAAGGELSQKRMTDTWIDVQENRKKKALAAEARWRPKRNADAMHMHEQTDSKWNANQNQLSKNLTSVGSSSLLDEAVRKRKWTP